MPKLNRKLLFLIFGLLIGIMFLSALPLVGRADFMDNEKDVYIGPEEIVEGNFIQVGETIDFSGQAQKDVIIVGGTITVSGPVKGDVIVAGGNVKITGKVDGSVRVAGGMIEINSKIDKNVIVLGGTIVIGQEAEIGWSVLVFGGSIDIRGKVNGDITGGAGNVILANEVGGNVNLKISSEEGQLILYPQTYIKGNLTYSASQEVETKEGAQVVGETIRESIVSSVAFSETINPIKTTLETLSFLGKIMSVLALLAVGLIMTLLFRKKGKEIVKRMLNKPWTNIGWGLIYLIITPIVLVLIAITIIGIPLALIVLALYLIILYITKVFIGIALGQKVLEWWSKKQEVSLVWSMVLGVILFSVLIALPFVGQIIQFLGLCLALGAIVETKKHAFKQAKG